MDLHSEGIPHYFEGAITPFHLYAKAIVIEAARKLGGTASSPNHVIVDDEFFLINVRTDSRKLYRRSIDLPLENKGRFNSQIGPR